MVPLALNAGAWAVAGLAAVALIIGGHVAAMGELVAARVALAEHRRVNLERIMAHRREEVPTMIVPLTPTGRRRG